MAGFIYIMSNPAFPDLIKIGKSKKDPTTDRVSELNQTGVPQPFKVEYYSLVENENLLERLIHQHFENARPNKNREFFSIDPAIAINIIRELALEHSLFEARIVVLELKQSSATKNIIILINRAIFLHYSPDAQKRKFLQGDFA